MGTLKKVIVYEGKKLLFIPILYLVVCIALSAINLIGVSDFGEGIHYLDFFIEEEKTALGFFYGFCLLLFSIACYRAFASRTLYQKVRVKAETVFAVRMVLSVLAIYLYLLLEMAIGSVRLSCLTYEHSYPFVLTFLHKPWWYALCFPCSVAVAFLVAYAVAELIANISFSRFPIFAKLIAFLLVVVIVCFTHAMTLVELDGFTFGHDNIFVRKFPVGAMSRGYYLHSFAPVDVMFGMAEYELAYCMLSWNIYNLPTLLTAVLTVCLSYFSFAFFSLRYNESYLYPSKTGGKKQ